MGEEDITEMIAALEADKVQEELGPMRRDSSTLTNNVGTINGLLGTSVSSYTITGVSSPTFTTTTYSTGVDRKYSGFGYGQIAGIAAGISFGVLMLAFIGYGLTGNSKKDNGEDNAPEAELTSVRGHI